MLIRSDRPLDICSTWASTSTAQCFCLGLRHFAQMKVAALRDENPCWKNWNGSENMLENMTEPLGSTAGSLHQFQQLLKDRSFRPPFWLRGAHRQTLVGSLMKRDFSWGWKHSREDFVDLLCGARVRLVSIWQDLRRPKIGRAHV